MEQVSRNNTTVRISTPLPSSTSSTSPAQKIPDSAPLPPLARSPPPSPAPASTGCTDSIPIRVRTIDLSLPPEERYLQVASEFQGVLRNYIPQRCCRFSRILAQLFVKRVFSKEQNAELKGISKEAGISMYRLVLFNLFLQCCVRSMGGGAHVKPSPSEASRMMHFQRLDTCYANLDHLLVQFNFVSKSGGEVVARTLSYVGFVGVLVGVKKGLSVSLQYRDFSMPEFYLHHIKLFLGLRPSTSAILRDFIVPRTTYFKHSRTAIIDQRTWYSYEAISNILPGLPSTSTYITFCNGSDMFVLEKGLKTSKFQSTHDFIISANHDVADEQNIINGTASRRTIKHKTSFDESIRQKALLKDLWSSYQENRDDCENTRQDDGSAISEKAVPWEKLKDLMVRTHEITTDIHSMGIMDPIEGDFKWVGCRDIEKWELENRLETEN